MSKSFDDIFAETTPIKVVTEQDMYDKGASDERKRIVEYLESRLGGHWGCRGSRFCPECIQWHQAITYIKELSQHD